LTLLRHEVTRNRYVAVVPGIGETTNNEVGAKYHIRVRAGIQPRHATGRKVCACADTEISEMMIREMAPHVGAHRQVSHSRTRLKAGTALT
jgi:hypothetical protein